MDRKKKVRENILSIIAIFISIISLFISGYTLYLEHLKRFNLIIEEGSSISIRKLIPPDEGCYVCIPVLFINTGAQGGIVKVCLYTSGIKKKNFKKCKYYMLG